MFSEYEKLNGSIGKTKLRPEHIEMLQNSVLMATGVFEQKQVEPGIEQVEPGMEQVV